MPPSRKGTVKSSAPFARPREPTSWCRTVAIGQKKVTIKPFQGKVYIHLNDNERNKSVTFNRDNFTTLVSKVPQIVSLINACDLFLRKGNQQRKVGKARAPPTHHMYVQEEEPLDFIEEEQDATEQDFEEAEDELED